jgi:membrane protein DedA with SNARE-associated domain
MALLTPLLVSLGALAVLLAALVVFAETGLFVGFFLPGDSLLLTVGVLTAAGTLPLPLWFVIGALLAAAVAGDTTGYAIGRRYGPRLFSRSSGRLLNRSNLGRAERFLARFGPMAVILARFVPWARTFVPVVAGAGRMPHRRFTALNVGGGAVWVVGITSTGYLLGQVPWIADNIVLITLSLAAAAVLPVLGYKAVRLLLRHRLTATVPARADGAGCAARDLSSGSPPGP